jgi:hypothetical protein
MKTISCRSLRAHSENSTKRPASRTSIDAREGYD